MGINAQQLREYIIRPCLQELNLYSESAENLLLGTCAQESQMGTYIKQINGPALGIFQIEPATHKDVWDNYLSYRPDLSAKILEFGKQHDASLVINLAYATAIARIIYLRAPDELPRANDVAGLAQYYKRYYNTINGAGTTAQFINNYQKYVLNG